MTKEKLESLRAFRKKLFQESDAICRAYHKAIEVANDDVWKAERALIPEGYCTMAVTKCETSIVGRCVVTEADTFDERGLPTAPKCIYCGGISWED